MSSSDEDFLFAAYYRSKAKKLKNKKLKIDCNEEGLNTTQHQKFEDTDLTVGNEAEVIDEVPPQFHLENDDLYEDCCGKVFITKSQFLVIHCSLCDDKYGTLLHFLKHLTLHHYCQEEIKVVETNWSKDSVCFSGQEQNSEQENEVDVKPELHTNDLKDFSGSNEAEEDWNNIQPRRLHSKKTTEAPVLEKKCKEKPDTYKCNQCEKHFRTKSGLGNHIERHSEVRKYKCTICGMAFKERSNCNAHIKRHTGEKKHGCRQCGKRFFTRTEEERHLRTHTGERPYICSKCGRDFPGSSELKGHMMRHDDIRPHKCTFCEKKFFSRSYLKNHIRVHTNERPFACLICSARFKRRNTLKQHNKLHINARSYACNICDKTFNQKPALLSHMKIHHKIL